MALIRNHPICPKCGIQIEAIYGYQGENFVGDTFVRWDFEGHKCKSKIQYQRIGDDTFFVLAPNQKPIKGRLKNFMNGLTKNNGHGITPSSRSDLKWLTDKQYHGK